MLDVAVAYNRFQFLGNEFLTWVWFLIENGEKRLRDIDPDLISLDIGNRLVLENNINDTIEKITIKGDDAGLEEGTLSLQKGALVTELNLIYKTGNQEWKFNIKGESLNISSLKCPETGNIETKEDIEGAVLEKTFLYEKAFFLVDNLYNQFIQLRVTNKWNKDVVPRMKKWIARP